jgi:hypothetical protein
MRAGYGTAGVTSAGSPLDAHSSSATAAELDRQDNIYNGQMRAKGYSTQEALYQTAAGTAIQQGNEATSSALIKGISGMAGQGSGLLAGGAVAPRRVAAVQRLSALTELRDGRRAPCANIGAVAISALHIQPLAYLWIQRHGNNAVARAREMVERMRRKGDT